MTITVDVVLSDRATQALDSTQPVVVSAGPAMIALHGADTRTATLDGSPIRLSTGDPKLVGVDLTRSTAYHRLDISGQVFWFGTEDAKLRLDGIVAMLPDMQGQGLGWGGQILFSDGALLRDPHVVYGWLDDRADAVLDSMDAINRQPAYAAEPTQRLLRRGGPGVDASKTLALLRGHPREYLVRSAEGDVV